MDKNLYQLAQELWFSLKDNPIVHSVLCSDSILDNPKIIIKTLDEDGEGLHEASSIFQRNWYETYGYVEVRVERHDPIYGVSNKMQEVTENPGKDFTAERVYAKLTKVQRLELYNKLRQEIEGWPKEMNPEAYPPTRLEKGASGGIQFNKPE